MLTSWLHDTVLHMGPAQYLALAASVALLLAALVLLGFDRLRYLRVIEDTPTSRVRSAAQGYVELEGKVEFPRTPPLTSPLRGIPCVWWSYRVEDAGRVIESGRSHEPFLIRDGTGACVVDPDQAHISGAETRVWMAGSKRCEESLIRVGQPLYALGLFRTSHDHAETWERREVGELVSTWQLDRIRLAERFDANRNGTLDAAEWDAIWLAATAAVRGRRANPDAAPDLHVLCDPGDRPYLLSALGQRRLAARFWFESITSLLACAMAVTLLVWSLGVRGLL
jgi:hypothetical protein